MTHQVYGYVHFEYSDEDPEVRTEALGSAVIFCDYGPRNGTARVNLNQLLAQSKEGDFICVDRIDQVADSVSDFHGLLVFLKERGVGFEALDDAFILRPRTNKDRHKNEGTTKQKNPWNVQVPDEPFELIGRMAALERSTSMKWPRGFAFDFAADPQITPILTLDQVLGAEQQRATGLPLARIATALRVSTVELFKALRRDYEYSPYPKM